MSTSDRNQIIDQIVRTLETEFQTFLQTDESTLPRFSETTVEENVNPSTREQPPGVQQPTNTYAQPVSTNASPEYYHSLDQQQNNINDLIYYYNRNFQEYQANISPAIQNSNVTVDQYNNQFTAYQQNIQNLIYILHNMQFNYQNIYQYPQARTTTTTTTTNNVTRRNANEDVETVFTYIFPLEQRLTQREITAATETVIYDQHLMNETRCPITLENFTDGEEVRMIRHCRHYFKTASLMQWLRNHHVCPVCRHDLLRR